MLSKKRIIFSIDGISGYKESIERALNLKFKEVYYLEEDIIPKDLRDFKFKLYRELSKKSIFFKKKVDKILLSYYDELLLKYKNPIDYFFVIAGREFSKEFLKKLKYKNPNIKMILFLWDKYEGTSLRKSADEFDYIFTFDREDAEKYNFEFRPSFYIDECLEGRIEYQSREYNAYYIGALRDTTRYCIIEKLSGILRKNSKKYFLKLFVNKKNQKKLPLNYRKDLIIKEKIDYFKNIELLKNSKVVLDLNHGKQSGLTLRVFESLATETKVITTNKDIVNYDFYCPENIKVIENEQDIEKISIEFFEKNIKKLSFELLKKYSALGFVDEVFSKIK